MFETTPPPYSTEIDLNRYPLYGYEDEQSDLVLDSLIRALEQGSKFPPVCVAEFLSYPGRGVYYIHIPLRLNLIRQADRQA